MSVTEKCEQSSDKETPEPFPGPLPELPTVDQKSHLEGLLAAISSLKCYLEKHATIGALRQFSYTHADRRESFDWPDRIKRQSRERRIWRTWQTDLDVVKVVAKAYLDEVSDRNRSGKSKNLLLDQIHMELALIYLELAELDLEIEELPASTNSPFIQWMQAVSMLIMPGQSSDFNGVAERQRKLRARYTSD